MGCLMCGLAFSVGVHAQVLKPFPDHWGEPPALQTRDLRPLPGGYGREARPWLDGSRNTWIRVPAMTRLKVRGGSFERSS